MRLITSLKCALSAVLAMPMLTLAAAPASAQTVVPLEAYSRLSNISSVDISPDGRRLAFITGAERDATYVVITRLDGSAQPFAIPGFSRDIDDELLVGVSWMSDRYVMITYRERIRIPGGSTEDADVSRRVIYDLEETDYIEFPPNATLEAVLPNEPDEVIISAATVQRTGTSTLASRGDGDQAQIVTLYRYNLEDGDTRRIVAGSRYTSNWILDASQTRPFLRQDFDFGDTLWRIFRYDGRSRDMIYEESFTIERFGRSGRRAISSMSQFVGEDVQGRGIWFSQLQDRNLLQAYLFDPETGEVTGPHIDTNGFDFGGFRTDWRTGKVIGAGWFEHRRQAVWFDPEFASIQDQLDGLFPLSDVTISSWDLSGQRMIVSVSGGDTTQDYYLLDRTSGELAFVTTAYPEVPQQRVHPVTIVEYEARDGLPLWGYLTTPIDRSASDLPLIIAPHGGPQSRDVYGFDPLFAQPFADMGYAVFQPHFRGSDGTGLDFVRRGHGEWGRAMQNDISDAVLHLADTGVVDADRVCIWGWSYGGYAALAGYALTPELYRCAIAGAPVSDIFTMMDWQADQPGGAGAVNYWTEYIGDWRTQRAQMTAISPLRNIDNTNIPLLLIHGAEDDIVPVEQAELMYDAVREAGKPVEYVRIEGDGHNLLFRRTRLITLEAATEFLMEHNPPDPR